MTPRQHRHEHADGHGHGGDEGGREEPEEEPEPGRPGALESAREWLGSMLGLVMPARGHEFDSRSTAYPPWAQELWGFVRKDVERREFSALVAETRAFKRFVGWGKEKQAAVHLTKMAEVLRGKDDYVVDKFEELTGIPIGLVVEDPECASEVVSDVASGEVEMRIAPEGPRARDAKAELEARWKERLWERFEKNTASVVSSLKENDLFHAESSLMEVVFQFDGLQPERRAFIKQRYLEAYGVDLERLLELKSDERGQLKEFVRLVKEKREVDAMLDSMAKEQGGDRVA